MQNRRRRVTVQRRGNGEAVGAKERLADQESPGEPGADRSSMTAESGLDLDGLRDIPAWIPDAGQLADLELLLAGALAPLTGFMGRRDTEAVRAGGRLAD